MRLIDANKLEAEFYQNIIEQVEKRPLDIVRMQSTIDAIPIEWIKTYVLNNPLYSEDNFNLYIGDMLYEWHKENDG